VSRSALGEDDAERCRSADHVLPAYRHDTASDEARWLAGHVLSKSLDQIS
jgi:hypothetical protein